MVKKGNFIYLFFLGGEGEVIPKRNTHYMFLDVI